MRSSDSLARDAALALTFAACTYSAALCFINTRVAHVSATTFAAVDAAIVLGALVLALRGASRPLWILLAALGANFLLINLVADNLEIKAIRDLLIVVAFAALGWRFGGDVGVKRLCLIVGALVIVVGLIELAAPRTYVWLFDVIEFYRAREAVSLESTANLDSAFFISSLRDETRMLLPALGPHRVSSIFLEPVSMGNFGALTLALALALDRRHWRAALGLAVISVIVIVLADARFASMLAPFLIAARFIPRGWIRPALIALPVFAIALLITLAASDVGSGDDLATRLAGSGRTLLSMPPQALLGVTGYEMVLYDAGYAYAFSSFGLPLCIALWAAFVWLPTPSRAGERYKLLLGVYVCALLCISGTSVFALKTAGLGFFALGALSAARRAPARMSAAAPLSAQRAAA